jgi:hypothetical protein
MWTTNTMQRGVIILLSAVVMIVKSICCFAKWSYVGCSYAQDLVAHPS